MASTTKTMGQKDLPRIRSKASAIPAGGQTGEILEGVVANAKPKLNVRN